MQQLILHIGRHKTGTTALQYSFVQNAGALTDAGVHYPEAGRDWVAHHDIANRIADPDLRPAQDELVSGFLEEIRDCGKPTVLVSSEGFQRCDPKIVKKVFQGFKISVVVYLREQVSYLQSSYLQAIHAENYHGSIEEYERDVFGAPYPHFLAPWLQSMGRKRVIARIFSREFMTSGDVVTDFFQSVLGETLGIRVDGKPVELGHITSNSSLKGDAIAFKKRLNAVLENDHHYFGELYKALGVYSGKIDESVNLISSELTRILDAKYLNSNINILNTLSLPTTLLDFSDPGEHQVIEWMAPGAFHDFLQMLIGMDEACAVLLDDCYRVALKRDGEAWRLEFCPNVRVDSLDLVRIERDGDIKLPSELGEKTAEGFIVSESHFNPVNDRVLLQFADGQTVNLVHTVG